MLRSFNKKNRDKITFDEFTNNIKNNKLDDNFNENDQKVLLSSLTYSLTHSLTHSLTSLFMQELFKLVEKHQDPSGAIPIKDIIGCVDQRVAISDTNYKKDMFAIRDFLAVQLKKVLTHSLNSLLRMHSLTHSLTHSSIGIRS